MADINYKQELLTAWVQGNVYPEPAGKTSKLKKQFVTYIIYDTILTGMGFLLYFIIN